MAESGNENPAGNQQGDPQGVGERMGSLEAQLSELMTLVVGQQHLLAVVETQQRERVESSGSSGVAPEGTEPEAGAHHLGATGRAAGGTGGDAQSLGVSSRAAGGTGDDAQGLGGSGMRVGSRGVVDPGLNLRVSDENLFSGPERVALRDVGPKAGAHQTGAAGGTTGSTGGDAQGFGESSTRVGRRSLEDSDLNPRVAYDADRSSVAAVNFGSIGRESRTFGSQSFVPGTVGGALGSQSSVPHTSSPSSSRWENVASGNTWIPGADISNSGEKLGGCPFKVPKAPEFNGTEVSCPSWSQSFLLNAQHNNLCETLVSEVEIPIVDIVFDLTLWIEKGFSVDVMHQPERARCFSLRPG